MKMISRILTLVSGVMIFALAAQKPLAAETACFSASKAYRVHPLRGGKDLQDGWSVKADAFNQCVHRAESADRLLFARHPQSLYQLSPTATIGCHQC